MIKLRKLLAIGLVAAAANAGAQGTTPSKTPPKAKSASKTAEYKKDLPDSLVRVAKVTEAAAAATALAKVPKGKLSSVELEREGGKLLYSYDVKVTGESGIDEVQVDAMTGEIVGKVVHESPAAEKKEAADESKQNRAAPKTTIPAKKPPV